jgi:hypothetical protein
MRNTIRHHAAVAILIGAFTFSLLPAANAQGVWPPPEFRVYDMMGSWAVQVSGPVFLPPPFDTYNGQFVRTGRLLLTPDGKLSASVAANYSGVVERENLNGTFTVSSEGKVTISLINVPLPSLPPGVPNVFSFEGVLCDGAKRVKLMMSGVQVAGQQLPNIGTVIFGELIRQ